MRHHGRRLLVVDDAPDVLEFMELLLAAEGFEVRVAQSLEAAEAALAAARPDLVICDVRMPGKPSFAFLDRLRGDKATRDVPVVVCTGAVQEVQEGEARLAQARTTVLFKPFDIEALLDCIDHMLSEAEDC